MPLLAADLFTPFQRLLPPAAIRPLIDCRRCRMLPALSLMRASHAPLQLCFAAAAPRVRCATGGAAARMRAMPPFDFFA
jgi:hypothetical protein